MNNHKSKVWPVTAGIIFAMTVLVTVGFVMKVVGLNMLPTKYLSLAIFGVVFLLLIILAGFFFVPWPWKKKAEGEETPAPKKNVGKYVARTVAMILAVALVAVDAVGIKMITEFENTFSEIVEDETEQQIEEFVIGVYVRVDDRAENLEDAKRYAFGYSLGYDRNNTKKGIDLIEAELDRNLDMEEFSTIIPMVDAVLAKEKDAFILSQAYLDILEAQEGYSDISSKIKCIHEVVVTSETQTTEKVEDPLVITEDAFVVYISGHDTDYAAKRANSDVNILAVVNPTTKQVLLLNTPRDFYIPISVSDYKELDKLTHCGIYGVECSMETLTEFYDVDVNYYAQLNFTGFKRLIDAIGGISVYCEKDIVSHDGHTFVKGINHLNGEQALSFVRERKQFGDGDHARGRHQMAVIKGIIEKMSSGSLLRNYDDVLNSMGKYFKCNLSQDEITSLVKMQLNDLAEWNVQSFAVVGTGKNMTSYSLPDLKTYVMIPDDASVEHAKKLIQMVFDGETIEKEDLEYK